MIRSRDQLNHHHTFNMPSGYSSREDPGQMKKNKQSMADLKLRRLTELNTRLREDLERDRIPVSQAAKRYFKLPSLPWIFKLQLFLIVAFFRTAAFHLYSVYPVEILGLTSAPASSLTPTARKTSWFRLSGVAFQREKIHTLCKPQEVGSIHLIYLRIPRLYPHTNLRENLGCCSVM